MRKLRLRWIVHGQEGELISQVADAQTRLCDAKINSLSSSAHLRSFPAVLCMRMCVHTSRSYRTFVVISAAQHPCTGGMLHLRDGSGVGQTAEAENNLAVRAQAHGLGSARLEPD